jgi:hypothetical protein
MCNTQVLDFMGTHFGPIVYPLRDKGGCKKQPLQRFPYTFGQFQVDKAYSLTTQVVQLLTSTFILTILAAEPCFYDTTLSVCDPGSPRARSSDRTPYG